MLLILTRLVSPTPEASKAPSKAFSRENPSDEPLTRKNFVGVLMINLTTSQTHNSWMASTVFHLDDTPLWSGHDHEGP
jgi:hypothetical protein